MATLIRPLPAAEPTPSQAAMIKQGPGTCSNTTAEYAIEVPAEWWYSVAGELACSYLDPEPFTLVGAAPQDPVAITITVYQAEVGSFYAVVSREGILVAGHPAVRWELQSAGEGNIYPAGTRIYEYVVQLGLSSAAGPNLVAHTDSAKRPDYEQNKGVLDAVMATFHGAS